MELHVFCVTEFHKTVLSIYFGFDIELTEDAFGKLQSVALPPKRSPFWNCFERPQFLVIYVGGFMGERDKKAQLL